MLRRIDHTVRCSKISSVSVAVVALALIMFFQCYYTSTSYCHYNRNISHVTPYRPRPIYSPCSIYHTSHCAHASSIVKKSNTIQVAVEWQTFVYDFWLHWRLTDEITTGANGFRRIWTHSMICNRMTGISRWDMQFFFHSQRCSYSLIDRLAIFSCFFCLKLLISF